VVPLLVLVLLVLGGCGGGGPEPAPTSAPTVPSTTPSGTGTSVPTVDVRTLGARGDGTTDDRPALQAAFDLAAAQGAEVVVPPGTYLLASATLPGNRVLRTYPGQHVVGGGASSTVLRLAPSFGPYVTVLGLARDGEQAGRWSLRDLTIDQNATADNWLDVARSRAAPQMVVRLGDLGLGSSVEVSGCTFTDTDNVNTLYLFGDDVEVRGNAFLRTGGRAGHPVHDHSTLYLTAARAQSTLVVGSNVMTGVPGAGGARTAIETHGGIQVIAANRVTSYLRAVNLTGVAGPVSPRALVSDNQWLGVAIGVQLWSLRAEPATTAPRLAAVTVQRNVVSLDGAAWERATRLDFPTSAMLLNPGNTQRLGVLVVRGNDIVAHSVSDGASGARYNAAISCPVRVPARGSEPADLALPGALRVDGNHVQGFTTWLDPGCLVMDRKVVDNVVTH
jgi:hypothetical protein